MDYEAEDVGDPVFLLSLDGGGIRGISEAVILHEIMKRLQDVCGLSELPKPCDHFHLIGGTSTGGLMAIMLGRLRMNTQEVIDEYEKLAKKVFKKKNRRFDRSFRESALEACIKETVDAHQRGTHMLDFENEKETGLAFVVAMRKGGDENTPTLFRTYKGTGEVMDCQIWEAARATTAAPIIFKPAKLGSGNQVQTFIDGAVKWNNPSKIVLNEAKSHFGGERPLGCLISLGTGQRPPSLDPGSKGRLGMTYSIGEITRMTTDFLTDPEGPHVELTRQFRDCPDSYYRFSLPSSKELGRIRIHEYKKMSALKQATEEYLSIPYVSIAVDKVVEALKNKYKHQIPLKAACHTITPSSTMSMIDPPGNKKKCSPIFTGREGILDRMDQFFHPRDPESSPRRDFWLWGIGGVGKTQIALRFMDRFEDRFAYMFWIDATNQSTILESIRNMAKSIFTGDKEAVDPGSIMSWLQTIDKSWLLVVDNYDDGDITRYLPTSDRGNIIFTSRRLDLPPKGLCVEKINISEMGLDDASRLLIRSANLDYESETVRSDAEQLVHELGSLPLALDQAGSYIGNRGCSIQEYIVSLRSQNRELLKNQLYRGSLFSNKAVYASFDVTINHFISLSRGDSKTAAGYRSALQLLNTFCFYHHSGLLVDIIPLAIHHLHERNRFYEVTPALCASYATSPVEGSPGTHNSGDASRPFLGMCRDGTFDAEFLVRGFEILGDFSLLKVELGWDRPSFAMHNLVHSWARHRMTPAAFKTYHQAARNVLFSAIFTPFNVHQERIYTRLVPHMKAVRAYNAEYHDEIYFPHKTEMDRKLALALNRVGLWEESVPLLDQILEERIYEYGRDDRQTLEVMISLAKGYRELSMWNQAADILTQVADRLPICPDPYWARDAWYMVFLELAIIHIYRFEFRPAQQYVDAIIHLVGEGKGAVRYLLAAKLKQLLVYQYQLKWREAEAVAEELYEMRMKRNDEGFAVLRALRELCFIRIQLGRAAAVEGTLIQLAERFELSYGIAHTDVLKIRADLGWAYFKQGKFEEAEETLNKVLTLSRSSLGNMHNLTLAVIFRLGATLAKLGKLEEGASLVRESCLGRCETLTPDNPATVGTDAWWHYIQREIRAKLAVGEKDIQSGEDEEDKTPEGDKAPGEDKARAEDNPPEEDFGSRWRPYAELTFCFTR